VQEKFPFNIGGNTFFQGGKKFFLRSKIFVVTPEIKQFFSKGS